ncbi:phosphodiester glycosidase family protein [Gracilimonas sp.]|uniref:phosphodiester glycosidase family protein n=1 Tax=Gracilimonas sp. TaxID=1974203 RepID=UPI0032EE0D1A
MKKSILIFALSILSIQSIAQIKYDTLSVQQIGDGIFHYTIEAPAVPWTFDVVEVDLTKSETKLETVKAQDTFGGYEKTSSMSQRKSFEGHQVVAAVNGDFYGGGNPTNAQVIKGEIIKKPISRDVFGYTKDKKVFINPTAYTGKLRSGNDEFDITGINQARTTDALVYYNQYFGSSTGTNQFGTELILKGIDEWVVNGEVRAVVVEKISAGDAEFTDSTFVLSGHGTSANDLDGFQAGDTVRVEHQLLPGYDNIKEVVGGRGKFLNDGNNEGDWPERHPRTAVGFNADSTKLYLMTVDGRQASSAGMTLTEMGEFMKRFGVENALNLDGGGSTTMVVHNNVVNDPSDGIGERAVANALMVVSSKEKTGLLENLNLAPSFKKVYRGNTFNFSVSGSDVNHYPIELDSQNLSFSLSEGFDAAIDSEGNFTAGNTPDTGYVYLEYEGLKDTAMVIVKGITDFSIFPQHAVTDSSYAFNYFNESYDFDGQKQEVGNAGISWEVENPDIGMITNGTFKGISEGITNVIGTYDGVSDTAEVEVQIGTGRELLSSFESLDGWSLDGLNIDLENSALVLVDSVATDGEHSLRLDYEFEYNNTPTVWAYLETDIPVFGVPDSINFHARTDGKKHLIDLALEDNNGESFTIRVKKWAESTDFDIYPSLMSDLSPVDPFNTFYYPITIKSIGFKLASDQQTGERYSGSIFIDNLEVVYPNQTAVSNEKTGDTEIPTDVSLKQNYPNPFNPTTKISFTLPSADQVDLEVFDVLGRRVASLVDERLGAGSHTINFDASRLSSGIYLYRLTTGEATISRKMTLIK